jgi:hypothetical protein
VFHLDEKTRFSLMVAIHGFRRTVWMYLITAVATGLAMGSVVMLIMRPGFWLVWLFGLRLAWLVVQEGTNWWWERWTRISHVIHETRDWWMKAPERSRVLPQPSRSSPDDRWTSPIHRHAHPAL